MQLAAESLERLVPERLEPGDVTGQETLRLHLERYEFAARHARGRVLDIACGVGYGTRLLAERGAGPVAALGVDLSEAAVAYAREHYAGAGVRFLAADAMRFDDPEGFDAIVSLETVEHLPEPDAFVARLAGLLRPGGVLVASVPSTPSVDVNPHHRHDFSERSFRALLRPHGLEEVDALRQVQPVPVLALLARSETRMRGARPRLPAYYARHPGALLRRLWATARHGFANHYLTLALRRPCR